MNGCVLSLSWLSKVVILSANFDKYEKYIKEQEEQIVEEVLNVFSLPRPAREIYLDLVRNGASTARMISERLGMTRPSVYDQVKSLLKKGLIVERDVDGKTEFSLEDADEIESMLEAEEFRLKHLRKRFSEERERMFQKTSSTEPKIRFFSGREAILQAMHDMLWDDKLVLHVVWPYRSMLRALGKTELSLFNEKRLRNTIRVKTIWTEMPDGKQDMLWKGRDEGVERRTAPKDFSPSMGYTIYGDKVLFTSSEREVFGFLVRSEEFSRLLLLQFDLLWRQSIKEKKK